MLWCQRQENVPNYANRIEAIKRSALGCRRGADMVMVKPGAYLDIVREVKNAVNVPVTVFMFQENML
jgi:porphobilinogen synthase